jgi:hypothetical protein
MMVGETPSYNQAAVRRSLIAAFTPEDLPSHNGVGQVLLSDYQSIQAMPTSGLRPEERSGFGGTISGDKEAF